MSRSIWLTIDVVLIIALIASAWFAFNARQVARPGLGQLAAVELPAEDPPLPPAPFARTVGEDAGLLSARDLFNEPEMARFAGVGQGEPRRPSGEKPLPAARTLVAPPTWPSIRPPELPGSVRGPEDPLRFRLTTVKPEVLQYFGSHLIPASRRESDIQGPPGEVILAPAYATPPRGNPNGPAAGLGRAPAAQDAIDDDASGEIAAADPPQAGDALDGLILISVLRNRTGGGRALIRTPQSSALAVTLGEEIVGWRVSTIGDDFINLRRGSQTRVLRMPQ